MEDSTIITLVILFVIAYVVLYFQGRHYLLESFDDKKDTRFSDDGTPNPYADKQVRPPEKPYATNRIDNLDEYELAAVFQNEGSKEASKKQISDAMTRYPMDWSVQGQNSQYFQENQAEYEKENGGILPKPLAGYYKEPEDTSMKLPDSEKQEEEEQKILQTYQPKHSKDLLQYSVDDVKALLHRVYGKKGLIPVINKSKQGENIWEVTEVKEKHPKIVWEDEVQTERQIMDERGEQVISVPLPASDIAAGLDPFFQGRPSTRMGKSNYTTFTPGLERMFAPTQPMKSWF